MRPYSEYMKIQTFVSHSNIFWFKNWYLNDIGTWVPLQFELLDHRLALKAEEEVVCCQGGHRIPSSIGSTGDMWEDHCGGERINMLKKSKQRQVYWIMKGTPQFLSVKRGWFVGRGSGTVTSKPAAAIWPVDRALYRSSWFTTPPLITAVTQIGNNFTLKLNVYHVSSSICSLQTHIRCHLSLFIN